MHQATKKRHTMFNVIHEKARILEDYLNHNNNNNHSSKLMSIDRLPVMSLNISYEFLSANC